MKELKKKYKDLLEQKQEQLKHLGTLEKLQKYLDEEIKELDISNTWDKLQPQKELQENPNNILIYYLAGSHLLPTKLEHKYSGESSLPDVDIDYEPHERERVKNYLRDRFGERNCMEVATLQGTAVKGAIQDLARIEDVLLKDAIKERATKLEKEGKPEEEILEILATEFPITEIPAQDVYKVTTSIKYNVNDDEQNSLEYLMDTNPKLKKFFDEYDNVYKNVSKMKEVYRGTGTHASAFIVASQPLDEYIPCIRNKQKNMVTGYTESSAVKALQSVGLVKLDLLGLQNLTVNRKTEKMVYDDEAIVIDWNTIDIDDKEVYKLLCKGMNGGIFQMDGGAASSIIATVQPDCFSDLTAVNALMRPASLETKQHIAYKHHKDGKFDREHFPVWKDLKGKVKDFTYDILDMSWGIPIYQEQTMALLAEFCEISFEETDKARKIIGIPAPKKTPEHWKYIDEQKKVFLENATRRVGPIQAQQWWDIAVGSLTYGFNLAHSVSYAMIAFRQLYLKRYHPKEFFCSLIEQEQAEASTGKKSSFMRYIIEAKQLGVPIECPDINHSQRELAYNGDILYIGFEQIKGIGDRAVDDIICKAPYESFEDFLHIHRKGEGSKVTKTTVESLIYANAFRSYGSREELLYKHFLTQWGSKKQEKTHYFFVQVCNLLNLAWGNDKMKDYYPPNKFEILKNEHSVLSTVLSTEDPIKRPYGYLTITRATETPKGRICKIKGVIESKQKLTSRAGKQYIKMVVNDLENSGSILIWRNQFSKVYDAYEGDIIQLEVKHMDNDTFFLQKVVAIHKEQ